MHNASEPLWRLVASQYRYAVESDLEPHVAAALASPAVQIQREILEPLGLRLDPLPILWKKLPEAKLRLFFQVLGDSDAVEDGQIVALVLLHDLDAGRTLYAHTIHAGPRSNPLLKHLLGPMAAPKAQEGVNGERATIRLLEHKETMWTRFLQERDELGAEQAGQLWRDRYFWSLVRLYHCARCSACRWGMPQFEGPPGEPFRPEKRTPPPHRRVSSDIDPRLFANVRRSETWDIESRYAQRGGFEVFGDPQLAARFGDGLLLAVYPTDAEFLEAGSLVGLAVYVEEATARVRYALTLCAGPDPEFLFMQGECGFGFPPPQAGAAGEHARREYALWRREAWSRFWLWELEDGIYEASARWLNEFFRAIARLFGLRDAV